MADPSKQHGRFRFITRLGVGGTAEIFLAEPTSADLGLPKQVVVKRLLPQFQKNADARGWLEREAAILRAVRSPNIVEVYEVGIFDEGAPYIVLEFVDGIDLERLLSRLQRVGRLMPVGVAIWVATHLLTALETVHSAKGALVSSLGLIHRDVSPSNLYLSKSGEVRLGDFGIAISDQPQARKSASSSYKGKLAYLSPEQIAESPLDQRSDLFSAACILAEMLIGTPLFGGPVQLSVLLSIREGNLARLEEHKDRLDPRLYAILCRALSRDPADRFPSAREFRESLTPWFESSAQIELAGLIKEVLLSSPSTSTMAATPSTKIRAVTNMQSPVRSVHEQPTLAIVQVPSWVRTSKERIGPISFAELVELLLTRKVSAADSVEFMGKPEQPIGAVEELSRFLPVGVYADAKAFFPSA